MRKFFCGIRSHFTEEEIEEFLEKVVSFSSVVTPENSIDEIEQDPADNKVLECAVKSGADYIISGDSHLLDLENFRGVEILSPDVFLEELRG